MRIVSHTCSNTEIVCALGCADLLVGVDDHSDFPADVVNALPKLGADLSLDVDHVAALQPDLVLTSLTVPGHEQVVADLARAGLPHVVIDPTTLQDVADSFIEIAKALGVEARGKALAATFLAAFKPPPASKQPTHRVLVEWWPKPVIAPTQDSWVNEILFCAGAINPFADRPGKSQPLAAHDIAQANPETIIMSWCGVEAHKYRPDIVRRRENLQSVQAIKDDRIFPISEAYLGRPGPRLVAGLAKLRGLIGR